MITPLAPDPELKAQFNDIVALLDWLESGGPSDSMTTPASITSLDWRGSTMVGSLSSIRLWKARSIGTETPFMRPLTAT